MRILNENVSKNILNKLNEDLNESNFSIDNLKMETEKNYDHNSDNYDTTDEVFTNTFTYTPNNSSEEIYIGTVENSPKHNYSISLNLEDILKYFNINYDKTKVNNILRRFSIYPNNTGTSYGNTIHSNNVQSSKLVDNPKEYIYELIKNCLEG